MHATAATHALLSALPPGGALVDEAITTGFYVRMLYRSSTPGSYYFARGGGLGWGLPAALLAPQLAIILVFFYWPAAQTLVQSVFIQDAFGGSLQFVGLENFEMLFADELYLNSFRVTAIFSVAVTVIVWCAPSLSTFHELVTTPPSGSRTP